MQKDQLKSLLESLIFVSEKPLKISEMLKAVLQIEAAETAELEENVHEEMTNSLEAGELVSSETTEPILELIEHDPVEESEKPNTELSPEEQLAAYAQQETENLSRPLIIAALSELKIEYNTNPERGIELAEIAGGWKFTSAKKNAKWLRHFYQPKPVRLSKPALESLAMVAYRQPITRNEIDELRGVDSGGVLKKLLEKNLIRIVGKKEEPGKPMLYGTTPEFLEVFQLNSLKDLPNLRDFSELEEEFQKQTQGSSETTSPSKESSTLSELSANYELSTLSQEEEAVMAELDDQIKELRHLEKEIFSEEKEEPAEQKVDEVASQENPSETEVPTRLSETA